MHVNDDGGDSAAQPEISWDSIGASVASFANMAANGSFEVSETGGDALIKAIQRLREWATDQEVELADLTQPLPLGTSHTAHVMRPYVQQVAVDSQGFLTQLAQLQQSLHKAEEGIRSAMANYKATEEAKRAAFGNIEPA
ncbi:hypothetical protein ALI144C_49840 [Actinosynnema sp. ALI-1.44]|uniref:hypothetical protein n=1 Tax=Actinosynnema sp. ALI-1.44 TaxID=1933779 RepID=UPI00097BB05E|nr:hypothetical protein [Actinosynnema sp. ALI-1.44]ONI70717.1 hypothetical protein ALI144C_49840 [Actinosynnema sp. ALI-1.44]